MRRVVAQELDAQREFCLRLLPRVRRLVRLFRRHAPDADDALQAAFLEILCAADGYRGESALEHWADRIVIRAALRQARNDRRRDNFIEGGVDPDDVPAAPRQQEGDERLTEMFAFVDQLPEERRTVVILRCVMGYSVEEVGGLTGVSPNTVKDRLRRGREQIRQMYRRKYAGAQLRVTHE